MEKATPEGQAARNGSPLSKWEWLPPIAAAVLAAVYFTSADAGSGVARFSLFVGLGLLPGTLWRLSGRSAWGVHRVCFAAGLVAFVLNNPGLRPDRTAWERMLAHWPLIVLGSGFAFTQPFWGALRIRRILIDSGVDIGRMEALKLCLSGAFFNIVLPGSTGGDAYRVYAIAKGRHGARLAHAVTSVSLDRFLGLPALILVVVAGVLLDYGFFRANPVLADIFPFIAGAGVVCLILLAYLVVAGRSRHNGPAARDDGRPRGGPLGWLRSLHALIAANFKRPATLPLALLYGFCSHLASIGACLCFGTALGVAGVPAIRYLLIVPMAMAINAIPGAPGGLGQGELAMAELLELASPGMANAQAGVVVMLLFRLSNIAVGVAGGVIYAMGKRDFRPGDAGKEAGG